MPGEGLQKLEKCTEFSLRPGDDRPLADGQFRVGDHKVLVEIHPGSEAAAIGAGAVGTVEREGLRLEFGKADATPGAGIPPAEDLLLTARFYPDKAA